MHNTTLMCFIKTAIKITLVHDETTVYIKYIQFQNDKDLRN